MSLKLRLYQAAAITALYEHLRTREDNPCIVIPTAGGKSLIMATICQDAVEKWEGRVLVLAHVKELLTQIHDELKTLAPHLEVGMYSAGLKRRDTKEPVLIAGIQSVYKRAQELGHFDLIIIDEAHLIPTEGEGRYRSFLEAAKEVNPNLRIIGLTATPYRMKSGMICDENNILNEICYEAKVRTLMDDGFLCKLRGKAGRQKVDLSEISIRAGEFVAGELESYMNEQRRIETACDEILKYTEDRKAVLVFACGIAHARAITHYLRQHLFQNVGMIFGTTPNEQRDEITAAFKEGRKKFLVNVNVLTTGFNVPHIDCIALLRPTMSPGLFYQMVGRGFRINEGKENCLILDFGGNTMRHGPVDAIEVSHARRRGGKREDNEAPVKVCPECQELIHSGFIECPECGFLFPEKESKHDAEATDLNILSDIVPEEYTEEFEIHGVTCSVWTKAGAGPETPETMRVDYSYGVYQTISEWICLEHEGYARQKARTWWKRRSKAPVPERIAEAVQIFNEGGLAETIALRLKYKRSERFPSIDAYALGDVPEWELSAISLEGLDYKEVEF